MHNQQKYTQSGFFFCIHKTNPQGNSLSCQKKKDCLFVFISFHHMAQFGPKYHCFLLLWIIAKIKIKIKLKHYFNIITSSRLYLQQCQVSGIFTAAINIYESSKQSCSFDMLSLFQTHDLSDLSFSDFVQGLYFGSKSTTLWSNFCSGRWHTTLNTFKSADPELGYERANILLQFAGRWPESLKYWAHLLLTLAGSFSKDVVLLIWGADMLYFVQFIWTLQLQLID